MYTRNRRLRPLGITDILDETVDLYKTNFALLIGISAVLYVPYTLIAGLMPQPKFSTAASFDPHRLIWLAVLLGLFYIVINPLVTGALTFAISERYLDRKTTVSDCYKRVAKPGVLLRFICATLLIGLVFFVAFVLPFFLIGMGIAVIAGLRTGLAIGIGIVLIFAGIAAVALPIWLAMRFTLVAPAFFIESEHTSFAISRSWNLMKGNALKALGLLMISGIVVGVIEGIVSAPTSFLMVRSSIGGGSPSMLIMAIHTVLNSAVGTILMPITSIVVILLYYDVRIRKEGFDLELLANELDRKTREMSVSDITSLPQEQTNPAAEPEKHD